MTREINWIDPTKSEWRWNGRTEINWIDPTKSEWRWNG
jgi:hypothetical protein